MKHAFRLVIVFLIVGLVIAAGYSQCAGPTPAYIGNLRSHVFHRESCRYLPTAKNRTYFHTRGEATDAGYRPCRKCRP